MKLESNIIDKGGNMKEYAEDVIVKAVDAARQMAENGEILKEFNFGQVSGSLWISSDESKVVVDKTIEVDGKPFYIGLFKK